VIVNCHGFYQVTEPRNTYYLFLLINTHSINRKKAALKITFNRIKAAKSNFQYICCNCSKAVKFKLRTKMCYLNRMHAAVLYRTHLWPLSLDNIEIHLRFYEVIKSNILPGHRISVLKSRNYREESQNWGWHIHNEHNTCKLASVGVGGLIRARRYICCQLLNLLTTSSRLCMLPVSPKSAFIVFIPLKIIFIILRITLFCALV